MTKKNQPFGFNITFQDLYQRDGLEKLDRAYIAYLLDNHIDLHNTLVSYRLSTDDVIDKDVSNFLVVKDVNAIKSAGLVIDN